MTDSHFLRIAENLDQGPMTVPKVAGTISSAFIQYLKLLYSDDQAMLVQHLGPFPRTAKTNEQIAAVSGTNVERVRDLLRPLASAGLVIEYEGRYMLPDIPTIVNHHHHRTEVGPDDIEAAKLYQRFFVEEGFSRYYQSSERGTPVVRVVPVNRSLRYEERILATEEAHHIIDAVDDLRLVPCPCRTRTEKLGTRACTNKNPVGYCIMMGTTAKFFRRLGMGSDVSPDGAKRYFDEMQDQGLVGTTDNFEDAEHSVICLCCGCCCSQLRGRTRWGNPDAVAPANFVAESSDDCAMCGACLECCLFGAISTDEELGRSVVDPDTCMGCGVCTLACPQDSLRLKRVERERPLADARELYRRIWEENHSG